MESGMWQTYFSNEECWLSVHSDFSLKWLFAEIFLSSTSTRGRSDTIDVFDVAMETDDLSP
jgi:hypothetical protein